ncbi:NUDIX domain-containing protein [Candidatus Pacearchaeota archaeon]|nr:NUDIX domain-containing protein [Candidatus Pacearchaeota archaeon]
MKQKILSFIVHDRKFLVLRNNPHPKHGGDFWFVVTGGVEKGENQVEAVKREVFEETGLIVNEIFDLNWGSVYKWEKDLCEELNFVSFVDSENIILNEEHTEHEWLNLDSFIDRIKWEDDKELLRKVLKKALNKKQYFKKQEIKDYGENEKN